MDNNKQLDDLFREKLGNYEPEFVPEHWQMMKSAIDNPRIINYGSSGSNIGNFIIIIASILIVSTGIITYVLFERQRLENNTIHQIALNIKDSNADVQKTTNSLQKINNNPSDNKELNNNQNNNSNNTILHSEKGNKNANDNGVKKTIALKKVVLPTKKNTDNKQTKNLNQNNDSDIKNNNIGNKNTVTVTNEEIVINKEIKDENFVNGVQVDYTVINSDEEVDISSKSKLTDQEKLVAGFSESEIDPVIVYETQDHSSIIDDYNADKVNNSNKAAKKERKNSSKKKNLEPLPDYKVGVLNNFSVNPAYTGFNQRHTINVSTLVLKPLYKPGNDFNVPFEYSIAYDFNFGKRRNCALGIDYKRAIGAAEGTMAADLTFSYRFNLARYHNLRVGASLSYYSSGINSDDLSFPDMIDQRHGFVFATNELFPGKTTKNTFDIGMGVWYSWKTLYVGISATHLTSPEMGLLDSYNIPREYLLSAGYNLNLNEKFGMLPAVELKYNEKVFKFSPGVLFAFNRWLLFGAEFRNLTDAGIILGCNLKDNVIINVHTGIPMSKVLINNFGIIDYAGINVRLQFGNKR